MTGLGWGGTCSYFHVKPSNIIEVEVVVWLSCVCDNLQIYANILYFAVFDYLKKVTFVLSYKTLNPVFVEHPLVV